MRELNAAINSLISQIDSMSDIARYEINKLRFTKYINFFLSKL